MLEEKKKKPAIVQKLKKCSDRQEESDRSNQGVASPDYAETLITNHTSSNHHIQICSPKGETGKDYPTWRYLVIQGIPDSMKSIPL